MKKFHIVLLPLCFFLFIFFMGCHHPGRTNEASLTVIEGRIYVTGNEPFTEPAVQTREGRVYTLRGDLVTELKEFQGQWVELKGELIKDQHFLYSSEGFLVKEYERKSAGGGMDE